MFNDVEKEYLLEHSQKDLNSITNAIDNLVVDIARRGKHLHDLLLTQKKLQGILSGLQEDDQNDDCEECDV